MVSPAGFRAIILMHVQVSLNTYHYGHLPCCQVLLALPSIAVIPSLISHWPKVVISCLNCSNLQWAHLFFCEIFNYHRLPLALNVALSGLAPYCSASISKTHISHNGHLTCLIKHICLNQGIKEGEQLQFTNLDLSHILFLDQSLCTCHSPNFAFQNNYP